MLSWAEVLSSLPACANVTECKVCTFGDTASFAVYASLYCSISTAPMEYGECLQLYLCPEVNNCSCPYPCLLQWCIYALQRKEHHLRLTHLCKGMYWAPPVSRLSVCSAKCTFNPQCLKYVAQGSRAGWALIGSREVGIGLRDSWGITAIP